MIRAIIRALVLASHSFCLDLTPDHIKVVADTNTTLFEINFKKTWCSREKANFYHGCPVELYTENEGKEETKAQFQLLMFGKRLITNSKMQCVSGEGLY